MLCFFPISFLGADYLEIQNLFQLFFNIIEVVNIFCNGIEGQKNDNTLK